METRKHHLIIIALLLSIIFFRADYLFAEDKKLSILRVSPAGEDVPLDRQIVVQFNRPVVPVGRMERRPEEVAVRIDPPLECEWRWLNTSSLACQLAEKNSMTPATRYELIIAAGFNAADGAALENEYKHSFLTARPKVTYAWINNWQSANEPLISINFDQLVEKKSLERHLFLFDPVLNKRYSLKVELGKYSKGDRWNISAGDALPADTDIKLMIEAGVLSTIGKEPGNENKELLAFSTFGDFKFAGVRCYTKRQRKVATSVSTDGYEEDADYYGDERQFYDLLTGDENIDGKLCDPTSPVSLLFTAPLDLETIKEGMLFDPDLSGGRKDHDPWENFSYYTPAIGAHQRDKFYLRNMPLPLISLKEYRLKAGLNSLKDVFGRGLAETVDFGFKTGSRPPRMHFGHQISVLEKDIDSHLPIIVTNLDKLSFDYETLTKTAYQKNLKKEVSLYRAKNIAYPFPIKIRELLSGKSGVIQGNIQAFARNIKSGSWFYSQVTPFHVHAKLGHYNSLVWVTRFDNGEPVKSAKVSIMQGKYTDLSAAKNITPSVLTDQNGIAVLKGTGEFDPQLKLMNTWKHDQDRILLRVEDKEDLAILPVSHEFDLSYETIYPYSRKQYGHIRAWGTTAQGVYKLGDTLQYKIYIRDQDLNTFVAAPAGEYTLTVYDPTHKQVARRSDIKLNEFGAFDGELQISKSWAVGWYSFELQSNFSTQRWYPIRVLISDFTPAPFRVSAQVAAKSFGFGDNVSIKTEARLHAGGPYADADTRVSAHISTAYLNFNNPAYEGYQFGGEQYTHLKELFSHEGKLDRKGDLKSSFEIKENEIDYGRIYFESAVSDDRGKRTASSATAEYFGRDRFVGLKQSDWILEKDKSFEIFALVINKQGEIAEKVDIEIEMQYEEIKSAKVKSPGSAYLTRSEVEWVKVDECKLKSSKGGASCSFIPKKAGYYKFFGKVKDSKGREQTTVLSRFAAGVGYVSWRGEASNSMQVTAEKNSYSAGETAKYLIQNPYPGATVLISIERYGIIKSWTQKFMQSTEVLEIPVSAELFPGFYVSVVVMSPRVDKPLENQVDLGKPAFKIGYARTEVNDLSRELKININPQRNDYKPGDKVNIDFEVSGLKQPEEAELAVIVLDEAVFDLISGGSRYFDPFRGFYGLESLDVRNFNILKRLIGRQKFEKKGANPGGGGGEGFDMRTLFKYVSYWNPSLKTSAGRARVNFEVPDNLTGWRVLALAVNKSDKMGLGEGSFRVNQTFEIRPALPNILRENDCFEAGFSVMNRSEEKRKVNVALTAEGSVHESLTADLAIELEPFKREVVSFALQAKDAGEIILRAKVYDEKDTDYLQAGLSVHAAAVLESVASYGSSTESHITENVMLPEGIRSDQGSVSLHLSPTVISGIDATYGYIRDYPYTCWEQLLTKAVLAAHYKPLKNYLAKNFDWPDTEKQVRDVLGMAAEFQAPNGGMAFFVALDEYVNPYLSAYTSLAFNWLSKLGFRADQELETKLDNYLLEYLRNDKSPDYYAKGMTLSVRATALAALAAKNKITLEDFNRFLPQIHESDLFGKAHFLIAANTLQGGIELRKKIADMLMSSANETGGKFIFSEILDDSYQRILTSELRSQCAVLSALSAAYEKYPEQLGISTEVFFKILRNITQSRNKSGYWNNTQENVFCLNALLRYAEVYEKDGANFSFKVKINEEVIGEGSFSGVRSHPQNFARSLSSEDAGEVRELRIDKKGAGRIYYQALLQYALEEPRKNAVNAGIEIQREVSVERGGAWQLLKSPYIVKQGELLRIDLFISVPAARNYVVVNDPIAAGLESLNLDLATTSSVDIAKKHKYQPSSFWHSKKDWIPFGYYFWDFYHKELRHDSARFYSEYLQGGNYHLSYFAQAIAAGKFIMPPVKAEEMYDPDVYGLGVSEELIVEK